MNVLYGIDNNQYDPHSSVKTVLPSSCPDPLVSFIRTMQVLFVEGV